MPADCSSPSGKRFGFRLEAASAAPATPDESRRAETLLGLKTEFLRLAAESDRNKAGLALERLLNRLFELFQLHPRRAFRVSGEQIDGSFELADQVYLVESKWERHALPEADLLVFRGKIEGKSTLHAACLLRLMTSAPPPETRLLAGKRRLFSS